MEWTVHGERPLYRDDWLDIRIAAVGHRWVRLKTGVPGGVQAIREDRILDEAHAVGGDVRRLCDLFGLSVSAAERYTATLDHPDLIAKGTAGHDET